MAWTGFRAKNAHIVRISWKFGTTGSTILWFLEQPKVGSRVYGIHADSRYSPYMPGQAFRYAEFQAIMIDAIYPDDFIICHA